MSHGPGICFEWQKKGTCRFRNCKFRHEGEPNKAGDVGANSGERSGLYHSTGTSDGRRRLFTKFVKDENVQMNNVHQAERFVEGMGTFESKADMLSKLDNNRFAGGQRLQDVVSFISARDNSINTVLVPLLDHLINDETARPLNLKLRNRMLMTLFNTPSFLDCLVSLSKSGDISSIATLTKIGSFLLCLAKAFVEARHSEAIRELAVLYRDKGIEEAHVLCIFLMVDMDKTKSHSLQDDLDLQVTTDVVCWATDRIPPGGRHDNDFLHYRDISIVPTLEELQCSRASWLPLASGANHVFDNKELRLLDSNFRLLREDAVSTMRDKIKEQENIWMNARIIGVESKASGGPLKPLSFVLQVDSRKQKIDWEKTKSFPMGGIIALCKDGIPQRLGTINVREHKAEGQWLRAQGGPRIGVVFDESKAFDSSLVEIGKNCHLNTKADAMYSKENSGNRRHAYMEGMHTYELVEVSQSFFTYQPVLKALQEMSCVPFADELVHQRPFPGGRPTYLPSVVRMPNAPSFKQHECNLMNWKSNDITNATSLDDSQAEALRHALSSRVALIQGPPGTGKTFIGALLARMIRENSDESILCVCYTNHALDQFLEHLYDNGERDIVRLGGRTKSDVIRNYQMNELARAKARLNNRRIGSLTAELHSTGEAITETMKIISEPLRWKSPIGGAEFILSDERPDLLEQFLVPDESDGFSIVGKKNKKIGSADLFDAWSRGEGCPQFLVDGYHRDELDSFKVTWDMLAEDRANLIEDWRQDILADTRAYLQTLVKRYDELFDEKKCLFQEKYSQILRDAKVIGATTTGAAQYRDILSTRAAGVVIVEEAGEVFESHVLSALSPETKHLILIGDHKQLRPKADNYKLTCVSKNGYNLDCSLFERLVCSKMPSTMLSVQHRMRPEIAEMVRVQTYPTLLDHESVRKYPQVLGVCKNVVFIDHANLEDSEKRSSSFDNQKTKANEHEANLVVELTRYFLLQGYSPHQIVVLTPYVGQILRIVRVMKQTMSDTVAYISELDQQEMEEEDAADIEGTLGSEQNKNVRVASIDNYQGEEADIIIISLVRSNNHGTIGFLKEEQRVNVLLSRARMGMYIVGNSSTLRNSVKGMHVWQPLLQMMKNAGQLLHGLPTVCQNHPNDDVVELCRPCDFRSMRPNGGCSRPCTYRMECGHVCPQACHPIDRSHKVAQMLCCEPCPRFPPECKVGHICCKLCKDDCGPCTAIVDATTLPCGHVFPAPRCHEVRNEAAITKLAKICRVKVDYTFECGHEMQTSCHNARIEQICPGLCGAAMECGHKCTNRCGACEDKHICEKRCERNLFCGHACDQKCHYDDKCQPCRKKCDVRCVHSSCSKECFEVCPSCVQKCDWRCEHQGQCPLVCGAPCSRIPCNLRCEKELPCGHICPSVCGERCPTEFCQLCCDNTKKKKVVDMIMMETYDEIDVTMDPIIVLPCGHFFAMSTLDGHMELSAFYEACGDGIFIQPKSPSPDISANPKCCPDCRAVIHSICRYGRVLRFAELRVLERKHIMAIHQKLQRASSVRRLTSILGMIEAGPMRRVFEACGGNNQVEVKAPDNRLLITTKLRLSDAYGEKIENSDDDYYINSKKACGDAISIADNSRSYRLACQARLKLASLRIKWDLSSEKRNLEIKSLLDSVLSCDQFADLTAEAIKLKNLCDGISRAEIKQVLAAMNVDGGYDYGGGWAAHWYECENGHPYFIGDCGQAMESSNCPECGAPVGGASHTLHSTNRNVSGMVSDELRIG